MHIRTFLPPLLLAVVLLPGCGGKDKVIPPAPPDPALVSASGDARFDAFKKLARPLRKAQDEARAFRRTIGTQTMAEEERMQYTALLETTKEMQKPVGAYYRSRDWSEEDRKIMGFLASIATEDQLLLSTGQE